MKKASLTDIRGQQDNFAFERALYKRGYTAVAGCDEAGRGPLAGPVVAACVVLPQDCDHSLFLDSKILSHKRRVELADYLRHLDAAIGVATVSAEQIDQINILQASLLAMKLAADNIRAVKPDFMLVDGKYPAPVSIAQEPLIKGESKSGSIAAASIIAKVERDKIMATYHDCYPAYRFDKNKGYPTKEHRLAIQTNGICPIHRTTFKGVREYVK
ncbi:MAG: ribonuclease HII [Desulforhopalus sp.]